jgi:hypothetical protein
MSTEQVETAAVEYREIPGFPGYRAGSDGSVWTKRKRGPVTSNNSLKEWRLMKQTLSSRDGYLAVGLAVNGKQYCRQVQRLVALAFIGPMPPGFHTCHNNSVRTDNRACNLRYDTPAGNIADEIKRGTFPRGERHGCAKLRECDVRLIKLRRRAGLSMDHIAKQFSVKQSTIWEIINGNGWRHVA